MKRLYHLETNIKYEGRRLAQGGVHELDLSEQEAEHLISTGKLTELAGSSAPVEPGVPLPDDFPELDLLIEAGIATKEAVLERGREGLKKIYGIGASKSMDILKAARKL